MDFPEIAKNDCRYSCGRRCNYLRSILIDKLILVLRFNILFCKPFVACNYLIPGSLGLLIRSYRLLLFKSLSVSHVVWLEFLIKASYTKEF